MSPLHASSEDKKMVKIQKDSRVNTQNSRLQSALNTCATDTNSTGLLMRYFLCTQAHSPKCLQSNKNCA